MAKQRKRTLARKVAKGGNAPSEKSRYGRKYAYRKTHGGWGFDYSEPKPWK